MSKLGAHTTGTPRTNYREFCKAKPAVVTAVNDGGALLEAKEESGGHTITIFRDTTVYLEAPEDFNNLAITPQQLAETYYPRLRTKWSQNPADYYAITNEQGGNDLDSIRRVVAYEQALMRLANAEGFKVCVLNLAGGSPGDFDVWKEEIAPFIAEAWASGNIYGRHAYGGDLVGGDGEILPGNPRRPIDEIEWLNSEGHRGGLAITEIGLDGGMGFAGVDRFFRQMVAYELAVRSYEDIIGMCMWNLGKWVGGFCNWQEAIPTLIPYMRDQPTPKWEPPTEVAEEPPIAEEPMEIGRIVDVSRWQKRIDWDAFKAASVNFAFIRASSGPGDPAIGSGADIQYHRNVAECDRLGIKWGPYHFLYPGEIEAQVTLFGDQCSQHRETVSLPPVLDVEVSALDEGDVEAFIDAWNARMPGWPLMIYTSPSMWNQLGNPTWSNNHHLWIAHWTSASEYIEPFPGRRPSIPAPWTDWVFWQWTSHGSIPGHDGRLDFDYFNGALDELLAFIDTNEITPTIVDVAAPGPRVDLTRYFTANISGKSNLFEARTMKGLEDLGQQRHQVHVEQPDDDGNVVFFIVKGGDGPDFPSEWEELRICPLRGTIQRGRDTSFGGGRYYELRDAPNLRWSNWCPVKMAVGESYQRVVGALLVYNKADGTRVEELCKTGIVSWIKLEKVYETWESPDNDIVLHNVAQLRWSNEKDGPMIEDYYFSADPRAPGLVGWDCDDGRTARVSELHEPGQRPNSVREEVFAI